MCLLTLLFIAAGFWQVARAHYKERLQAEMAAAASEAPLHAGAALLDAHVAHMHRLEARGSWMPERAILLDNKVQDGVVGYEVVTPLKLEKSDTVLLVDRGWIAAPPLRSELPDVTTPDGTVSVAGIARIPNPRFIELGSQVVTGRVWQNLTIERYATWSGLRVQPVMLYQEDGAVDGLVRVAAAPEAIGINADRHRVYALTWFSLAGVTVILGALNWWKKKRLV
ncbi:MAG TPA: SURF1 family protein [Rhodocyclaceae bacterium]|nr:SURF1 family protein [Rhodocyclaceae bacterium]